MKARNVPKARIEFDVPENCGACPFYDEYEHAVFTLMECIKEKRELKSCSKGRPDWCPLQIVVEEDE